MSKSGELILTCTFGWFNWAHPGDVKFAIATMKHRGPNISCLKSKTLLFAEGGCAYVSSAYDSFDQSPKGVC